MSENAAETTAPAEAEAQEAPAQEPIDWKAKAREWERRAKENKTAADRLAELEEANKTAEQKAAERLAAAEAKAAELEAKAIRAEVAAEKGVPAALLNGATREELEASAEALIKFRGDAGKQGNRVAREGATSPSVGGGDERDFARALFGGK